MQSGFRIHIAHIVAWLYALDRQGRTAFELQQVECTLVIYWTFDGMDILDAVDSLDDVLKLKCYKAIAAVQRTLDLYGWAVCTRCADHAMRSCKTMVSAVQSAVTV